VTGTVLNALAILLGGIVALLMARPVSASSQLAIKLLLGGFTIYVGLSTTWNGLNGTFLQCAGQVGIALLAMILGNLTGKALRLQKSLNRLGQYAKETFMQAQPKTPHRWSDGFITCSILYCATPIAVLGALQDGLADNWKILGIKAVMDGFAAMAFIPIFGWGVLMSIVPVVAFQGTLALLAKTLGLYLQNPVMLDAIHVTSGLLVFSISLIILDLKKVTLADYLPSLIYAPLLAWLLR